MSAFVGFSTKGLDNSEEIIKAMLAAVSHRGPDASGFFVKEGKALATCLLDTSGQSLPALPLFNAEKTKVIALDGLIYNAEDLRSELENKGRSFESGLDAEIILQGFEEYGEDILLKLRGMFAFVIWDTEKNSFFAARDIFGIKPFYYYEKGSDFLFASEIKAFLEHPHFVKEFNADRLPEYLAFEYIPDEETLFKNVNKLLAGHSFCYESGKLSIKQYYDYNFIIDPEKEIDHWVDLIEKKFSASVKLCRQAGVEVGCFLSSGVDSSYVAAEMVKEKKMRAFSVGFAEEKISELPYAQEYANSLGIEFISRTVSAREFFDISPTVQYQMDEPLPNPSALPLYFLSQLASKELKTVLSGEGSDELFGGYSYYKEPLEFEKYQKLPRAVRTLLAKVVKALPAFKGKKFIMRGSLPIEKRFIRNQYVFSEEERKALLPNFGPMKEAWIFNKPYFDKVKELDDITKMQYVDLHSWAVFDIMQKADKMSAAHGLELRMPFLDIEILKVALQIPVEYRVSREKTKIVLRKAALRQMPAKNADKKKLGFPVPLNDWLRDDVYYTEIKALFLKDFAKELFNTDYAIKLLDDHKSGKSFNMKKVWSLYCLLVWYEEYFIKR